MAKVEPFTFYYESGITLNTGIKVDNIGALYSGIEKVSESSIFYHLHHSYFRRHFAPMDTMNDFARWLWLTAGEQPIAEKIAILNPFLFNSVKACRKKLLDSIKEYIGNVESFPRVTRGREFYFLEIKSFIHPTGFQAGNLKEFKKGIDKLSISSLFYHLIDSRTRIGRYSNDFSIWLSNEINEKSKAKAIEQLNLFSLNLWEIKNEIIDILEVK